MCDGPWVVQWEFVEVVRPPLELMHGVRAATWGAPLELMHGMWAAMWWAPLEVARPPLELMHGMWAVGVRVEG